LRQYWLFWYFRDWYYWFDIDATLLILILIITHYAICYILLFFFQLFAICLRLFHMAFDYYFQILITYWCHIIGWLLLIDYDTLFYFHCWYTFAFIILRCWHSIFADIIIWSYFIRWWPLLLFISLPQLTYWLIFSLLMTLRWFFRLMLIFSDDVLLMITWFSLLLIIITIIDDINIALIDADIDYADWFLSPFLISLIFIFISFLHYFRHLLLIVIAIDYYWDYFHWYWLIIFIDIYIYYYFFRHW